MKMNLDYLYQLGYTKQEVEEYAKCWDQNIVSYLAENSAHVVENMRYLQKDFSKELLLKLPVFYSDAFTLSPLKFAERICLLKQAFPDEWADIIEKQFWGYDGIAGADYEPLLMAAGSYSENDIVNAIDAVKNPGSHTFEFMVLLKREIGIELTADDIDKDWLLTLEISKYEVVENAKWLVQNGLSSELISELLWHAPLLMTLSVREVEKLLIQEFGENDYILAMEKAKEDDTLGEILTALQI